MAYVQSNGQPRVDLDLNGLTIFIAEVPADASLPTAPAEPYIGWIIWGCVSMTWMRPRPNSSAVAPR